MKRPSRHPSRPVALLGPPALAGALLLVLGCQAEASSRDHRAVPDEHSLAIHGVNYDPGTPARQLSRTPLKLEAVLDLDGESVPLAGDFNSWIAGVTLRAPLGSPEEVARECETTRTAAGANARCAVELVRFAQYGVSADDGGLEWLLEALPGSGGPAGTARVALDDSGAPRFPATAVLSPAVRLTLQKGEGEARRLTSREAIVLEGQLHDWPEGLMVLRQAAPLALYDEGVPGSPDAEPAAVLRGAVLAFADKPSEFFRKSPRLVRTTLLARDGSEWTPGSDVGGVELSWTDTGSEILSSSITGYRVYRNRTPGNPGGWELTQVLPPSRTALVDRDFDGRRGPVEYLVTHEMEFPFDLRYEGLYAEPGRVELPVPR